MCDHCVLNPSMYHSHEICSRNIFRVYLDYLFFKIMCVFVCTSTHAVIYMYVNNDELHMLKSKINYSVIFAKAAASY